MAGHSHWAGIKHKKAVVDAKRGKLWTKLSKAIIVAARLGGGDPAANSRLRTAIADAKAVSMPKDNIERAIKRGTGELDGASVDEILYEGYGPHGVAVLCEVMTDNRNRTAPELRKLFESHGGNLGATGCVSYLFDRKGLIVVSSSAANEENLLDIAGDIGAEDIRFVDEKFEILTPPELLTNVSEALEAVGIRCESKQVARIPQSTVQLDLEETRTVVAFLEALDDHDDVQNVSSNLNIPENVLAQLS